LKRAPEHPVQRVGVIAPASAPLDPAQLAAGLAQLRAAGFAAETVRQDFAPHGYLCGTDAERLDELNRMLRRTDLDVLVSVRGGYGTLRLLPGIDYAAARRHRKLLVGYSDITALQLALYAKAGWRSLSGPMVSVEWPDPDRRSHELFLDLLRGGRPDPLSGPRGEALRPMRAGEAEGVLLGGNLALVTRLIGTPYLPSLEGAILFLEEVGEAPYRIDGMFAQLKLAGILERLGGLVLGAFTDGDPPLDRPSLTLEQVLEDYLGEAPYPVAQGLVYGHIPVKNAVPIGVRARLRVTDGGAALSILEPVV
jgi:muramoyltetrapeptide carboxypeptidase